MDFDLSKPQTMLQASVREFLTRECPMEKVRELMAGDSAFDEELWRQMADQGWLSLTLPEQQGGMGLGAVDLAVVSEAMGEACLPGPFVSNVWAASVLSAVGGPAANSFLTRIADGASVATVALLEESGNWDPDAVRLEAEAVDGGYRLQGRKLFVGDASVADAILWVARLDGELVLFALPKTLGHLDISEMPVLDTTRKLYEVAADDLVIGDELLLARGSDAVSALESAVLTATVATCAELVGGMQWVLDTSVEYAKTRQQFGKAIGAFQAVQHMCADMLLRLESARSATYYAAYLVSVADPEAARTVSIAKAYSSDAAREVCNLGVQVHGGIGFTWEHDLHIYFKRAKSSEILFGDANFHRERLAVDVVDGGVLAEVADGARGDESAA